MTTLTDEQREEIRDRASDPCTNCSSAAAQELFRTGGPCPECDGEGVPISESFLTEDIRALLAALEVAEKQAKKWKKRAKRQGWTAGVS